VLEVQRPHLVRARRAQPRALAGATAHAPTLAGLGRHAQAFLTPDALNALAVDLPALQAQLVVRAALAPPRPISGDLAQRSAQRGVIARASRLTPLRRAVLASDPTGPALTDTEAVAKHRDRLAPTVRAHQFPLAISFKPSMSSA
jgi:hypothetical protein